MPGMIIALVVMTVALGYFIYKKASELWAEYIYSIYWDGFQDGLGRRRDDVNKTFAEKAEKARVEAFKKIIKQL